MRLGARTFAVCHTPRGTTAAIERNRLHLAAAFKPQVDGAGQQVDEFVALRVHLPVRPVFGEGVFADDPDLAELRHGGFGQLPEAFGGDFLRGAVGRKMHIGLLGIEGHRRSANAWDADHPSRPHSKLLLLSLSINQTKFGKYKNFY